MSSVMRNLSRCVFQGCGSVCLLQVVVDCLVHVTVYCRWQHDILAFLPIQLIVAAWKDYHITALKPAGVSGIELKCNLVHFKCDKQANGEYDFDDLG